MPERVSITRLMPGDVVDLGDGPETVKDVYSGWGSDDEAYRLQTDKKIHYLWYDSEVDATLAPRTPRQRLDEVFAAYVLGAATWAELNAAVQAVKPEGE